MDACLRRMLSASHNLLSALRPNESRGIVVAHCRANDRAAMVILLSTEKIWRIQLDSRMDRSTTATDSEKLVVLTKFFESSPLEITCLCLLSVNAANYRVRV